MEFLISEILGWLTFLHRPSVLLQLLALAALALALVQLRRLPPLPRLRLLWRWPASVLLLLGELLIALLLALAGQRLGLVLLAIQIHLIWLALQLIESQLLCRLLTAEARQILVSRLIRPLFLIYVGLSLLDALGSFQDMALASLGVWFGSEITLGRLCQVVLVLYLLLVGVELPARWVSQLLQRGLSLNEGSSRALEQILRYALFSLGVVWALASLGVNQNGMLAVAGGLSVGLGFGIKEVFSNIISGLWLLIEGSVRPGEVLMHEGEVCEVRRLGPRATTLWRSTDNAELVVPNQTFFTTATTTYTRSDRMRRCSLALAVPRTWPPQQILDLLVTIAAEHPSVLAEPAPVARLQGFGIRRYDYSLNYSIPDPLLAGAVASELRLAIYRRFQDLGIDRPA
jgi:potassium efflux system protein